MQRPSGGNIPSKNSEHVVWLAQRESGGQGWQVMPGRQPWETGEARVADHEGL